MDYATPTWLAIGFGLGLVHAFDADHVMAMSVFTTKGRGAADGVRAGLRWSLGHGLVVLAAGFALLVLGRALPPSVTWAAERSVGAVMIALGIWVWVQLARPHGLAGLHLHFHEHDEIPAHAHWHVHAEGRGHRHEHGPLLVGGLHGLAGSAPVLAVLPVAAQSPARALGYLLLFAIGVGFAMAVASGALGHVAGRYARQGRIGRLARLRAVSASGSILVGSWLIGFA